MDFRLQNIEDYTKHLVWMLKALEQLEKEFRRTRENIFKLLKKFFVENS